MNHVQNAQDVLVNDHLRINDFLDGFQAAIKNKNLEKAKSCLDNFWERLERHIRCEEDVLFPALEKANDAKLNDQISMLVDEHVEIKEAIQVLERKLGSGDLDLDHDGMDVFYLLGEHNAREEYHVYPKVDELLSAPEAQEVTKALG